MGCDRDTTVLTEHDFLAFERFTAFGSTMTALDLPRGLWRFPPPSPDEEAPNKPSTPTGEPPEAEATEAAEPPAKSEAPTGEPLAKPDAPTGEPERPAELEPPAKLAKRPANDKRDGLVKFDVTPPLTDEEEAALIALIE